MKILFVSHSSEIGGAERVLLNLIREIKKYGVQSLVALPGPGPLEQQFRENDIETFLTELKWWLLGDHQDSREGILDFCDGIKDRAERLASMIRSNSIDLVVTNTSAIAEGALAAKATGVPHIWYIHELLGGNTVLITPVAKKLFFSVVSALSQIIIVVSQAVYNDLKESGGVDTVVKIINNGLEIKSHPETPRVSQKKNVITVGGIHEGKGIITLLQAARLVCDQLSQADFLVAGQVMDPVYYQMLLKERARLGLEERFHFLGFREDIPELLSQSDLLVLPSLKESFSMVILEAMNAALPVVATRSGGSEELIVDGGNGFLVPVGEPSLMAERILFLLNHESLARQMGETGYDAVKNKFSLEKCGREFIRLLEKLPSGGSKEGPYSQELLAEGIEFFDGLGREKRQIVRRNQEQIRQMEETHQKQIRQMEEIHRQLIRDFTSSHSWKLTKPLRWISRKINRQRLDPQ